MRTVRGVGGVCADGGAGRARPVRGVGAYAVRVAKCGVAVRVAMHVVAEHIVAECGGTVSVPACEIGREVRHVPPGCVPHTLYAQETCGDIAKPVLTKAGN